MSIIKFNVAQLLREPIGSKRNYTFEEPELRLDEQMHLRDVQGTVQFTRTASGVFAQVVSAGTVQLTCVRSLELFDERVAIDASEEMHSVVDVFTGGVLHKPIAEDPFFLDEFHMADVGEMIREYTLLALPIKPISPAYRDQPISYTVGDADTDADQDDELGDARLAKLRELINRQTNE